MTTFVLGGGCFWCLDALYRRIKGVTHVESGYAGGADPAPNYYSVADGVTGHAEVVKITFDEAIIPKEIILDIFFALHDPTTPNRQGADVGTQYRSILLYTDELQKAAFEAAKKRATGLWKDPIVTEIKPLDMYFTAEEEHQDYFRKNPQSGYCYIVIEPKLSKARASFESWFRD